MHPHTHTHTMHTHPLCIPIPTLHSLLTHTHTHTHTHPHTHTTHPTPHTTSPLSHTATTTNTHTRAYWSHSRQPEQPSTCEHRNTCLLFSDLAGLFAAKLALTKDGPGGHGLSVQPEGHLGQDDGHERSEEHTSE